MEISHNGMNKIKDVEISTKVKNSFLKKAENVGVKNLIPKKLVDGYVLVG